MTITLFVSLLTFGGAFSALFTEAIKKAYENANKPYSANLVALANALVIGCGGCAVVYMLAGIPWTVNNIICLILAGFATWIASMVSYDKVIQLLSQMQKIEVKVDTSKDN